MIYERRYETVTYPEGEGWAEGWGGFTAKIMVNPSGAELRHESQLFEASKGTDIEAQDAYWRYVAPRVIEWNVKVEDEDGNIVPLPPPAERWESFMDISFDVMIWLRYCIHFAHMPDGLGKLQGKKPVKASATAAGSTDSTPPTPLPLLNSSTPAASSSTA